MILRHELVLTGEWARRLMGEDVVSKREVRPARRAVPVVTANDWRRRRVLVVGMFLVGGEVSGVYTRAGASITGREALFVPLLSSDGVSSRRPMV
jgi:hypothetical protein